MILIYDIGTNKDLIDNINNNPNVSSIINNHNTIAEYAKANKIKSIISIDVPVFESDNEILAKKLQSITPINPLKIKLEEINDIELKSLLLDHDGDICLEKKDNNIFLNNNLQKILSFYKAKHIMLYGITKPEEILKAALSLSYINAKISIIEDAILPINWLDNNIKQLFDKLQDKNISFIKTPILLA